MANIKSHCVSCGSPIYLTLGGTSLDEYYNKFGNYCRLCNKYAGDIVFINEEARSLNEKINIISKRIKRKDEKNVDSLKIDLKSYKKELIGCRHRKENVVKKLPNYCDFNFDKLFNL